MPIVNPEILVWARERAGFSDEQAAKKLGLSSDRLYALEAGDRVPTRRQLAKMSETYRRSLLTFYLPKPPRKSERGQDFRSLPEGGIPGSEELLDAILRNIHARQGLVRAALEDAEEDLPLSFVGAAQIEDGVETLVDEIQKLLGFSGVDFRAQRTTDEAFAALRAATEAAGVFVLLIGNLGTHHTNIDARVFRGFALADSVAPFIVINENDARAAWSFTLLHELTHIFLGQTGVSGYDGEAEVERFCDSVAGRFLLDPSELNIIDVKHSNNLEDLVERIGHFASQRHLSRKMVAYNMLRAKIISTGIYRRLNDTFDADRVAKAAEQKRGAPDYYVVRRHRVGPGLVSLVKRMVSDGAMSTTKAGRVLGVKPTAVVRVTDVGRAA